MIIAVVGGSGQVGTALASRLAAAGHKIFIASRDPATERVVEARRKISSAAKHPDSVTALPLREACEAADVVLITAPVEPTSSGMGELAGAIGPCKGKPIIEATNPLTPWPTLELSTDRNKTSATEQFALVFTESSGIYKAFNTVGVDILANPIMARNERAVMMYAGPPKDEAPEAFETVTKLIADTDFEPLYVGPHRQARNLEAVAELWIHMANTYKNLPYHALHSPREFAWKVLYRQ